MTKKTKTAAAILMCLLTLGFMVVRRHVLNHARQVLVWQIHYTLQNGGGKEVAMVTAMPTEKATALRAACERSVSEGYSDYCRVIKTLP